MIKDIQNIIVWTCKRSFGSFFSDREKTALRQKVLDSPMVNQHPFDPEAKLLRYIGIRPSMLDIGASTGIYSAIMEDIVGSDNLYIFEPLPHLHRKLRRRFKRSHVFDFALSDKEGTANLRIPYINGKRYDTRATLNYHTELGQTDSEEIEVKLCPLDRVVERLKLASIGLVKIDVEGYELEVLDGAIETLKRFKPLVLIEIEARHHQFPIDTIFSRFEYLGYRGHYMNPVEHELLTIAQFEADRDQNQRHLISRDFNRYLNNFFFVHETAEDDFVSKAVAFMNIEKQFNKQHT